MTRVLMIALVALPVAAAPVPKEDDAARMIRIYGTRADPKDDAKYKMVGDALQLLSPAKELPPPRDLERAPSAELVALWRWSPAPSDASRIWRELTGDFTATVRVSFRLRPPFDPKERWQPCVAGLVAWSGDEDHAAVIRTEEAVKNKLDDVVNHREAFQQLVTYPDRVRTTNGALAKTEDAAHLRMSRKGNLVTGAYSRDGKHWTEFMSDEVEWTGNVKVGVYAKHFSDTPFAVTFDEYRLITPKN